MAKNRKKDKKKGAVAMDVTPNTDYGPKAMDFSEEKPSNSTSTRKIKKSVQMKRSKNVRKRKALERAISNSEKAEEKVSKSTDKTQRIRSAKTLYD